MKKAMLDLRCMCRRNPEERLRAGALVISLRWMTASTIGDLAYGAAQPRGSCQLLGEAHASRIEAAPRMTAEDRPPQEEQPPIPRQVRRNPSTSLSVQASVFSMGSPCR